MRTCSAVEGHFSYKVKNKAGFLYPVSPGVITAATHCHCSLRDHSTTLLSRTERMGGAHSVLGEVQEAMVLPGKEMSDYRTQTLEAKPFQRQMHAHDKPWAPGLPRTSWESENTSNKKKPACTRTTLSSSHRLFGLHCWAPVPPASSHLRFLVPPTLLLPRFRENIPDFPLAQLPRERPGTDRSSSGSNTALASQTGPGGEARKGQQGGAPQRLPCPAQEGVWGLPAQKKARGSALRSCFSLYCLITMNEAQQTTETRYSNNSLFTLPPKLCAWKWQVIG